MFRLQFSDPYLTDKFFQKKVVEEDIPPLGFVCPPSVEKLRQFMESPEGDEFSKHAATIIDQLEAWAKQNNIAPKDVQPVAAIMANIKHRFTLASVHSISNIKERFLLCTEGINHFHAINILLIRNHHSLGYKINQIEILIRNLNASCDDGVVTYAHNARSLLSTNPLVGLVAVKHFLAEEVATQALGKHGYINEAGAYGYRAENNDYVLEGNHVHYVNAMINFYNEQLGIAQIPDEHANISKENIKYYLNQFIVFVNEHFRGDKVIHELAKQFDLRNIEKQLAANFKAAQSAFELRLNVLGHDELFNLQAMLDQEALADDRYVFAPTAAALLSASLIERLTNNDYFVRRCTVKNFSQGMLWSYPDMPKNTVVIRDKPRSDGVKERVALLDVLLESNAKQSRIWHLALEDKSLHKYLFWELATNKRMLAAAKNGLLPDPAMIKFIIMTYLNKESIVELNEFVAHHLLELLNVPQAPKLSQILVELPSDSKKRLLACDSFINQLVHVLEKNPESAFNKFLNFIDKYLSEEGREIYYVKFIHAWSQHSKRILSNATFDEVMLFFKLVRVWKQPDFFSAAVRKHLQVELINKVQLFRLFNLMFLRQEHFAREYFACCVSVNVSRWEGALTFSDLMDLKWIFAAPEFNISLLQNKLRLFRLCSWDGLVDAPAFFFNEYYSNFDLAEKHPSLSLEFRPEDMRSRLLGIIELALSNIENKLSVIELTRLVTHLGLSSKLFEKLIKTNKGIKVLSELPCEVLNSFVIHDKSVWTAFIKSPFALTSEGSSLCGVMQLSEDQLALEEIIRGEGGFKNILGFKPTLLKQVICPKNKTLLQAIDSITFTSQAVVALVNYVCHFSPTLKSIDLSALNYEKYTHEAMYVYFAVYQLADSIAESVANNYQQNRFYRAIDNVSAVQAAVKLFLESCGIQVRWSVKEKQQVKTEMFSAIEEAITRKRDVANVIHKATQAKL